VDGRRDCDGGRLLRLRRGTGNGLVREGKADKRGGREGDVQFGHLW
jgi:hypothetical protein